MRELLDKHITRYLLWVDTRDMAADGLTKGAVARDASHEIMAGDMIVRRAKEQWCCKRRSDSKPPLDLTQPYMTNTFCFGTFETARCEAPHTAPAAEMAST